MLFEAEVRAVLDRHFPCCALSNVPIFRPDGSDERMRGYEIDHLLHIRAEANDRIIIVECKDISVFGARRQEPPSDEGPWNVQYSDQPPKNVKQAQLRNHARALRSYLHDHSRPVLIEGWLVSKDPSTPTRLDARGKRVHYRLFGPEAFARSLVRIRNEQNVLRIEQSALLGELRKGVPVRDMGHPELNNALAYVARCRNSIDSELFHLFEPTPQRWAINGTAGMGKSVLLAYMLFVLASDKEVKVEDQSGEYEKTLADFSTRAASSGIPKHRDRVIHAVARKEKQLAVMEYYWNRFVREYSQLESVGIQFQKPLFRKWDGTIDPDCNVLLIDEAHDLDSTGQKVVADWLNESGAQRYLAIACDRHQKLRLVGSDAVLIEGLNFSQRTRKLRRNYRNPFPIYAAGLGLMFRWFAEAGPKVIPAQTQLKEEFGFEVAKWSDAVGGEIILNNWNDSHPGNYWAFTVSTFLSCEDAFAQLANAGLSKHDVLWIRFGEEEEAFDYERLLRFTYHNCFTAESFDLVDKYVKGQEFPVVVIEGVPPGTDLQSFHPESDSAEKQMWTARRELYLCCS